MTPPQRHPKPSAKRKYRAIHDILSSPNLGPQRSINIPRVDDNDDINAGPRDAGQERPQVEKRGVVVELVAAERDSDGNGDDSDRQSNSGPVDAELRQTSGTGETPQRARNSSEEEETTAQLVPQEVARIPKRTCERKSRSIDELLRAPDFPMPPPVPRRAESNAEALEIEPLHDAEAVKEAPVAEDNKCSVCEVRCTEAELLECVRCAKGYHSTCAMPTVHPVLDGRWICLECSGPASAPSLQHHMPTPDQLPAHDSSKWLCVKRSCTLDELLRAQNLQFPPPVPQGSNSSEASNNRLMCDDQLSVVERAVYNEVPDNGIMGHDEEGLVQEPPVMEENGEGDEADSDAQEHSDDLVDDADNVREIVCSRCGSGDQEEELLLCDQCNKGYHMACARPIVPRVPNGIWVCSECSGPPQTPSLSEWDIINFLGIQDFDTANEGRSGANATGKKRKRSNSCPRRRKSKRQWLPYVPSKDKSKRLEQLGSLAQALISLDLEYTDELLYAPDMAPKSANQAAFDRSEVQVLQKSNKDIWVLCKAMHRKGECPPLKVVYNTDQGYMVLADGPIEDMTFICEYTGFVDYSKKWELDDSNSLMDLLETNDELKDLVISQDRCGNISHFLSGINNHNEESKRKQNCTFIRCNVDGECRIFIVTIRRIKAGTPLYIDYNAGGSVNTFPTQNFV